MAGEPYYIVVPRITAIELTGKLKPMVSAKDIILEVLRRMDVKGGRGKILEYIGEGVQTLSVPERATITNMGTETGATSSIFPSDEESKKFLTAQGREDDWIEIYPDEDANYSEIIHIDLDDLEPLIALPHSPGNVERVKEFEGTPIDQVCIGSCTNSSLKDLKTVAQILKGNRVHSNTSLTITPGSKQVLTHLAQSGELQYILDSGARILECTCGPCIGMGQAPSTNATSLRTFNRNFKGRSGTESASIYLTSPETAAASAIMGKLTDPRKLGSDVHFDMPNKFLTNDSLIIYPPEENGGKIIRGPNIKPLPTFHVLPDNIEGEVLLKVGDDITTDHILPAGARLLPLRSNIPEISKFVFNQVDPSFYDRVKSKGGGFIVGGENYGQGSSREHAALAPKYLGIKAVIAKSFSRIHESNLVNFGIIPILFEEKGDYEKISQGDIIEINASDLGRIKVKNITINEEIKVFHNLSPRNLEILKAGGKLPFIRNKWRNPR
jgi:aconitate hydratase